jgi:hypothetical protein
MKKHKYTSARKKQRGKLCKTAAIKYQSSPNKNCLSPFLLPLLNLLAPPFCSS